MAPQGAVARDAWNRHQSEVVAPVSPDSLLKARRAEIINIAASHGAKNVRVFGSHARGEETEDSDVDLLVDFDSEHGLLDRIALIAELEDLLGRDVDVVTEQGIYWLLRRKIVREAVPL
ncbi:MAG: nucleotidyltransferase family protein [Thermoleophilia bacterium]